MMNSVVLPLCTVIDPFDPAGTMAAFAMVRPRVDVELATRAHHRERLHCASRVERVDHRAER